MYTQWTSPSFPSNLHFHITDRKEGDIIYECKNCGHKHIEKKQYAKENNRLNEVNLKNQTRMENY